MKNIFDTLLRLDMPSEEESEMYFSGSTNPFQEDDPIGVTKRKIPAQSGTIPLKALRKLQNDTWLAFLKNTLPLSVGRHSSKALFLTDTFCRRSGIQGLSHSLS